MLFDLQASRMARSFSAAALSLCGFLMFFSEDGASAGSFIFCEGQDKRAGDCGRGRLAASCLADGTSPVSDLVKPMYGVFGSRAMSNVWLSGC